MNLRTRMALTLLVAALPAREVNVTKVITLRNKLDKLTAQLEAMPMNAGRVDVRDLLMLLLEDVA